MLDKHTRITIETNGQPLGCVELSREQKARLSRVLPQSYMSFLLEYGFGHYFDRQIQFCDPELFRPLLALIFGADPDFSHEDCYVTSFSAFGELTVWSNRNWDCVVDLPSMRIMSENLAPTIFEFENLKNLIPELADDALIQPNRNIAGTNLLPYDNTAGEMYDFHQEPMFARCKRELGRLERGECYGFVPALAMVGYESPHRVVENVKRMPALEHFTFLAQLGTFQLVKVGPNGFEEVRPIG